MKKKIIAVLLCVLMVCSLCAVLVACDDGTTDEFDNYVGTYIGYREGLKSIQFHIEIRKYSEELSNGRGKVHSVYVQAIQPDRSWMEPYGVFYKNSTSMLVEDGEDGYWVMPNGEYKISKIENNHFTMTFSNDKYNFTYHFKRTELSRDNFKKIAFDGDYEGAKPYYYED